MKKITLTKEQIDVIISTYQNEPIGMAEIGKQFGVSREVIKRILIENNIKLTQPGQKFKGGKLEASKRHREKISKNELKAGRYKKWVAENKERVRNKQKEWRENNADKLKKYKREYQKNLISNNPQYKLAQRFRTAIWQNIKDNGATKYNNTFNLLPYTFLELKTHLESLFEPGMNWANYGEWHVDHAIPQSKFTYNDTNSEEFHKCWALNNLKPMWGSVNCGKNDKLTYLSLDSIKHIKSINLKNIEYDDVLISKEYLESIINNYGKEYLTDYIDPILNLIRMASPNLPKLKSNETIDKLIGYINNLNPEDEYGNIVNAKVNSYGNMFLKSRFNSYWKSSYRGSKSPVDVWQSDVDMSLILKYRLGLNNSGEIFDISLRQMIKGISATRRSISFFKPLLATFLYRKYLGIKRNPTVFDPCCGFGGRLLGFKIMYPNGTYIGCEPNIETYTELINLVEELGLTNVIIHNCKFEDMVIDFNYDLALTSIPYFDLEIYSNPTEYNDFEDWVSKFVNPLLRLKNCVLNINNTLCERLKLNDYIDVHLINGKNHFKKIENKEPIIKLNFN